MELAELLRSWGLAEVYVQSFMDEEWTVESLQHLSEESIKKLIPKDGPRSVFCSHFNSFKQSSSNNNSDSDTEDEEPLLERVSRRRKRSLNSAVLQPILNAPDVNDLHKGLKKTFCGLIVLSHYQAVGYLDDYTRDLLCNHTLQKELEDDFDKKLTRTDFDNISDSIVKLFPTESKATWYDVVQKKKATTILGRLRNKYYALRRALICASLISKTSVEDSLDQETVDFSDLGDDIDDVSFNWLLTNTSPWDEVTDKWSETRLRRQKHLYTASKLYEYIEKFPCLLEPLGWTLLTSDGIRRQPNLDVPIQELWVRYSTFLLSIIRQGKPQFLKERKFKNLSSEQQFVILLKELPALFKARTLPKSKQASSKSNCWRPSRSEVLDAFCLHVNSIAQIEESITARKQTLEKYKFPLQAIPVFLGPEGNIQQYFIVLDGHRWEVANAFQAIQGTFQICFGLESRYPVEARHIWLFLQRTLFNITTSDDFSEDSGLRSFISSRLKQYELFQS